MRSKSDTNIRPVQKCVLLPITFCVQAVGIQDGSYNAVGKDLGAGAKNHFYLQKPGRGIPSPSLPLYIYSVPAATSNDQCHAENLGPWKGSSTVFAKASKVCKSACAQGRAIWLHCTKLDAIQLLI